MRRMPKALLTRDYPPFKAGDIVSYGRMNGDYWNDTDGEDFYLDNGEVRVYGVKAQDLTPVMFPPDELPESEKE